MNVSCDGEPAFGAVCAFACPEGWTLNGSAALTCDATGHWSGTPPTCEGEALTGGGGLGGLDGRRGKRGTIHYVQAKGGCQGEKAGDHFILWA